MKELHPDDDYRERVADIVRDVREQRAFEADIAANNAVRLPEFMRTLDEADEAKEDGHARLIDDELLDELEP